MVLRKEGPVEKSVFELVWNHTNDAIFTIGHDGRVLTFNPAFSSILGWTDEDLTDMNRFPFFLQSNKEEQEHQLNLFKQGIDIPCHVTKRKTKNGEILDILASYRSVNKGEVLAVGMYKDFTEQMKIQRQLKASEDCYRNLVETIPDAIFVVKDEKIIFINKPGVDLVGAAEAGEVIGSSFLQFVQPDQDELFKRRLLHTIKTGEPLLEKIKQVNGEVLWVELKAMSISHEGVSVLQFIARDVTAKKNYEEQLDHLAYHNPLTGVKNRRYFTKHLNKAIEQKKRDEGILAILYLDLDKFKTVNDTNGHEAGDELLMQFAD